MPSVGNSNAFYKRLTQLYTKITPNETKTKQMAQVNSIWSKVENDDKKIKTILQLLHSETKLIAR